MKSFPRPPAIEKRKASGHEGERDSVYAAVSIACGKGACFRAEAIAGIRFLLAEAPGLPLNNCSAETCTCRYSHFRDRRSFLSNRRSSATLESNGPAGRFSRNRRRGPNRRKLKILALDETV